MPQTRSSDFELCDGRLVLKNQPMAPMMRTGPVEAFAQNARRRTTATLLHPNAPYRRIWRAP
jgi:hypothetical protein